MRLISLPAVGRVSHWLEDTVGLSSPGLRLRRHQDFELLQQGSVVRILREGLYLVYAQVRSKKQAQKKQILGVVRSEIVSRGRDCQLDTQKLQKKVFF